MPVGFTRDGDDWIITATAAGAQHHPAWYFNLAAHPDRAHIVTNGERIQVTASQIDGIELARVTREVRAKSSRMTLRTLDRYRAATDRTLPLIRLRRASIEPLVRDERTGFSLET